MVSQIVTPRIHSREILRQAVAEFQCSRPRHRSWRSEEDLGKSQEGCKPSRFCIGCFSPRICRCSWSADGSSGVRSKITRLRRFHTPFVLESESNVIFPPDPRVSRGRPPPAVKSCLTLQSFRPRVAQPAASSRRRALHNEVIAARAGKFITLFSHRIQNGVHIERAIIGTVWFGKAG